MNAWTQALLTCFLAISRRLEQFLWFLVDCSLSVQHFVYVDQDPQLDLLSEARANHWVLIALPPKPHLLKVRKSPLLAFSTDISVCRPPSGAGPTRLLSKVKAIPLFLGLTSCWTRRYLMLKSPML